MYEVCFFLVELCFGVFVTWITTIITILIILKRVVNLKRVLIFVVQFQGLSVLEQFSMECQSNLTLLWFYFTFL